MSRLSLMSVLPVLGAPAGAAWVGARRDSYRRISAPLPREAVRTLEPFFGPNLLGRTEVARVPRIDNPLAPLLRRVRIPGALDLSTVRGMAFIDTIVIADDNASAGDDDLSLLFHELVHIVQYRLLGARGFVHAYLAGWLNAGRSYLDNPLEIMAFDLQDRFDASPERSLDVEQEVLRSLTALRT
jgi:hypothetical protein